MNNSMQINLKVDKVYKLLGKFNLPEPQFDTGRNR